jgi:diguanylate cyclase (GGDEF)-like protein
VRKAFQGIQLYIAAVIACGLFVAFLDGVSSEIHLSIREIELFVLLSFLTVAGELLPIPVKQRDQETQITISTTFSFALLLILGPLAATIAQGTASLTDDLRHKKPFWKAAFNAAQYSLSLHAAGFVLRALASTGASGGLVSFEVRDLPVIGLAGLVFFLVNSTLIGIAVTVAQKIPAITYFRQVGPDLAFAGTIDAMLMALSPILMVASQESLLLVPLLALPLAAVHRSATVSLERERLFDTLRDQANENEYQATHDGLTNLPNRILFKDRLEQALQVSNRSGFSVAVMLMDLDRFKEINDALGHQTGDLLLTEIAERLRATLRGVDTVGRLGGDEFAVVVPEVKDSTEATRVAERILTVFEAPFVLHGMHLHVDGSLGVAMYPEQGHTADVLIQRADVAMYIAKSTHSGFAFYDPSHDSHSPARLAMVDELRRAIAEDGLVVHYQPKVDLSDRRLLGLEALVRWEHPRQGLIPPMEFIDLAEQSGLIGPLTMKVLDLALEACSRWRSEGRDLEVAVNLSLQSLLNVELPNEVALLLQKWEMPPEALTLEITESCMMADAARTMLSLNRLNEMGVQLSIDDFGTGYSSLQYLRRLPVGEIKIDRSFVMDMLEDEGNAVIAESTIELGRNLGLKVVAEGVASQEIFDRLVAMGCDVAQGFHIAKPLDEGALRDFLVRSPYRARSLITSGPKVVRVPEKSRPDSGPLVDSKER